MQKSDCCIIRAMTPPRCHPPPRPTRPQWAAAARGGAAATHRRRPLPARRSTAACCAAAACRGSRRGPGVLACTSTTPHRPCCAPSGRGRGSTATWQAGGSRGHRRCGSRTATVSLTAGHRHLSPVDLVKWRPLWWLFHITNVLQGMASCLRALFFFCRFP